MLAGRLGETSLPFHYPRARSARTTKAVTDRPYNRLAAPATLDVELCERLGQRSLNGSSFLRAKLMRLRERFFCALYSGLGRGFIDGAFLDRHVHEDIHTILRNLDKTLSHSKMLRVTALEHNELTWQKLRQERDVHRIHADFALGGRKDHHLHVVAVRFRFGSNDFEAESGGHLELGSMK
jgi:hypothetical protein